MTKDSQIKALSDTRRFYPYCLLLCKSDLAQDLHQDYLIALTESTGWEKMDIQVFTHFSQNLIYSIFKKKADYRLVFEVFIDVAIVDEPMSEIQKTDCLLKEIEKLGWYEKGIAESYLKTSNCTKLAKQLRISRGNVQKTVREIKQKIKESAECLECLEK